MKSSIFPGCVRTRRYPVWTLVVLIVATFAQLRYCEGQRPTIRELAADAHARGETEVTLPLFTDLVGATEDVRSLGSAFSILEGVPLKEFTEVTATGIRTWYSIKIVNIIKNAASCPFCDSTISIPSGLKDQSKPTNVYMVEPGGTAVVNGVTITQTTTAHTDLVVGQKYLLVLAGPVRSQAAIFLSAGSSAVSQIQPDGSLKTAAGPNTRLGSSIAGFQSIQKMRQQLR